MKNEVELKLFFIGLNARLAIFQERADEMADEIAKESLRRETGSQSN